MVWSRILLAVGGLAMLVGAVDPMEGSLLILPGSGLVALGTYVGQAERWLITLRVWAFILIAIGMGALFGLSAGGGIGGRSGHSLWWGVLILPYPIGWSLGIWGPGSPRRMAGLGIPVGFWYLTIFTMALRGGPHASGPIGIGPHIVIATFGLVTIAGCIYRLSRGGRPAAGGLGRPLRQESGDSP
jgi:hypothetical protein